MTNLREKQIEEATKRMGRMGLMEACINDWKKNQTVWWSEEPMGVLFNNAEEHFSDALEELKHRNPNALPYHLIHGSYNFYGTTLNMSTILYVSAYEEDWEYDYNDLKDKFAYAFVYNHTDPVCSETGGISFDNPYGGLIRTA